MLHSPSTTMFKILTPTRLYDFYPTLTQKKIAFVISPHYLQVCPTEAHSFDVRYVSIFLH